MQVYVFYLFLLLASFVQAEGLNVYFSHTYDNPKATTVTDLAGKLSSIIQRAERRVYISIYNISNTTIIDAIVAARKRQVPVEVIIDQLSVNNKYFYDGSTQNVLSKLLSAGVMIYLYDPSKLPGESYGYNHNKYAIIDDTFWSGSFDFTDQANNYNEEDVIVVEDPDAARCAMLQFQNQRDNQAICLDVTNTNKTLEALNNAGQSQKTGGSVSTHKAKNTFNQSTIKTIKSILVGIECPRHNIEQQCKCAPVVTFSLPGQKLKNVELDFSYQANRGGNFTDSNLAQKLAGKISAAKAYVRLVALQMTSDEIINALIALNKKSSKVTIELVVDQKAFNSIQKLDSKQGEDPSKIYKLLDAGVSVYLFAPYKRAIPVGETWNVYNFNQAQLHSNFVLIDNTYWTGSFNFTENSNKHNEENVVIVNSFQKINQSVIGQFNKLKEYSIHINPNDTAKKQGLIHELELFKSGIENVSEREPRQNRKNIKKKIKTIDGIIKYLSPTVAPTSAGPNQPVNLIGRSGGNMPGQDIVLKAASVKDVDGKDTTDKDDSKKDSVDGKFMAAVMAATLTVFGLLATCWQKLSGEEGHGGVKKEATSK